MFPFIFEWVWDKGHLIFMGIFWIVILVLLSGIGVALVRTVLNTKETDDLLIKRMNETERGETSA